MPLSVVVVARNEEKNLPKCLETLRFADELVVALDRCTDGSREAAERANARIIEGSWPIEGDRRNASIEACSCEWIIEVDADERVPPDLAIEIRDLVTADGKGYDYFWIPYDNYIGTRLVRYGWGAHFGVSGTVRLFRKGAKKWGSDRVHPRLSFTGKRGPDLEARMIHYVDRNISDMIRRLDCYSTARAKDLRAAGDTDGFARNVWRIFSRFYKCYVRRKGYREGALGFTIAVLAGLYPFLSYVKARYDEE